MILILMISAELMKKKENKKNQPSKLPIHIQLREFILTDVLKDFDATSLYPSAI